ncbi:hypothetical protein, partial [Enterobacter intestinihominis]
LLDCFSQVFNLLCRIFCPAGLRLHGPKGFLRRVNAAPPREHTSQLFNIILKIYLINIYHPKTLNAKNRIPSSA